MSIINSTPARLDMDDWRYLALRSDLLRQVSAQPGEISFRSTYDYGLADGLRLRGSGFGDFDANGVPHSGVVTGATLQNNAGFLVYFEELSVPVTQFLAVIGSNDPAQLRALLLAGDDRIEGGTSDHWLYGGDILLGGEGRDTIMGFGGHDSINGGAGDDMIHPFSLYLSAGLPTSTSHLDGGAGFDFLAYEYAPSAMQIDLATGIAGQDTVTGFEAVMGSAYGDRITGSADRDLLNGMDGDDTLYGGAGHDALIGSAGDDDLYGGDGDDLLAGGAGANFLRGELGDDSLVGGGGFDDMHGNQGNDTLAGGQGFDWVVGGQGNDVLDGEAGGDVVYGNLGADSLGGGDGADWVRGGQGDDWIAGGADDDLIWGDRGDDTVSGGSGADSFHFFAGGGLDRITDFNAAEGDHIVLEGAPAFAVRQQGADTVIDLGGADRLVLVGINAASLPAGWLVLA